MEEMMVPESPCPVCGEILNAANNTRTGERPHVGDATICIYCAGWSIFDDDLMLRLPSESELAEIHTINIARVVEMAVLEAWQEVD